MKEKRGFTLLELVFTVLIIGVLATMGVSLFLYLLQDMVYVPNQLNADLVAQEALDIMVEGDTQAKGLRFSRSITGMAPTQITFVTQNGNTVSYSLNTGTNKLYRTINGGAPALIPYYAGTISVTAPGNTLFTYYDANESTPPAAAADTRRIEMALTAATGTGVFSDWEGASSQQTSIAVKRFQ